MSGEFDPLAALEIARRLSFPRRVGTPGEEQAAEIAAHQLEQAGYQVERQNFQFVIAPDLLLRWMIAAGLILAAVGIGVSRVRPALVFLPGLALVGLLFLYSAYQERARTSAVKIGRADNDTPLRPWPGSPVFSSCNLVACLPPEIPADPLPHLILMAHYDSKSQNMPLPVRMSLIAVLMVAVQAFGVVSLLALIRPELVGSLLWLGGLIWLAGVPLLFLRAGNGSPGALDNASGAGLVLHLAQVLAGQQTWRRQLRWTILITGAEEMGLMGAQAYVKQWGQTLQREAAENRLWVLNFDGVGVDGQLAWVGPGPDESPLASMIYAAAQHSGGEIRRLPPVGALYDHMLFSALGVQAGTLAGISKDSLSIHTRYDQAGLLHPHGFERAGQTALDVIERLLRLDPSH